MYHRMSQFTGLGNPRSAVLQNVGKLTTEMKECLTEATELWFSKWGGVDYNVHEDGFTFGIEPSYQYDELLIIEILKDKGDSWIGRGKAWGSYGSDRVMSVKYYRDYKRNGKFKKFVDKWHGKLFIRGLK